MIWAAIKPGLLRYGPTLALVVGVWLAGSRVYDMIWQRGWDARDAALTADTVARQARLDRLAADLRAKETALDRAAQERETLERMLAGEASEDPLAGDPGLGLGVLQRLNRIR